jgi:iron-sulfur cluster repair protein YtfE (RIC family)
MTATLTPSLVPAHLPDFLEGIIVIHGAMRRDAARLPLATDAVTTPAGARAVHRWFVKFAREVEHHHLREDEVVWPRLVDREASFGASLEVLEADHHALDAAMARSTAALAALVDDLASRADAVAATAALGQLLGDHLDREEAVMFPAMARVFTTESFNALEDELLAATPKRLIAFELPFAFDGLPADRVADKLTELPAVIRVLHRWVWQPAYDRLVAPLAAVGA